MLNDDDIDDTRYVIYTHPSLLLVTMDGDFVNYVRAGVGTEDVSFMRSMINTFYVDEYASKYKLDETQVKILADGHSMAELVHIIESDYQAFFNPAAFSLFDDYELWSKNLLQTCSNMKYFYLHVPYEMYQRYWLRSNPSIPLIVPRQYEIECNKMLSMVQTLNISNSFVSGGSRLH